MFKNISNLGSVLNKDEQKLINGGKLQISGASFTCYCNGENLGQADNVWACRFRCAGHNL